MKRAGMVWALVAAVLWMRPGPVSAEHRGIFLDAGQFTALGAFAPSNSVTLTMTDTEAYLAGSGEPTYYGVLYTNAGTTNWVFTFSSFSLRDTCSLSFEPGYESRGRPVYFLSQSSLVISGYVDAVGGNGLDALGVTAGAADTSWAGGEGANYDYMQDAQAGSGPGGGEAGIYYGEWETGAAGGGGGHGGVGGAGGAGWRGTTPGGSAYGDLTNKLTGGSGGGGGAYWHRPAEYMWDEELQMDIEIEPEGWENGAHGGGGGGALAFGALGSLIAGGTVAASGGTGGSNFDGRTGGGGAGGGILIYGNQVSGTGGLSVSGGSGGSSTSTGPGSDYDGGGGSGGLIGIYARTFPDFEGTYDVTGGGGTESGEDGVVEFAASDDVPALVSTITCDVLPAAGPYTGGNVVIITNCVPVIGDGTDITNVTFGGVAVAGVVEQGANWVAVIAPPAMSAAPVDIVIESATAGRNLFLDGYRYNPAGSIFGGMPTNDFERWTEIVPLPVELKYGGAAVLDGRLYVAGGVSGGSFSSNVYVFAEAGWTAVAPLPTSLAFNAVATFNGAIYSIGGNTSEAAQTNVYRFDGSSWTTVASLPAPRTVGRAAVRDGSLYFFGGHDGTDYSASVYRYDGTNWHDSVSLPFAMIEHAAVEFNGDLYAMGGARVGTYYLTNTLRFTGTAWEDVVSPAVGRVGMESVVYSNAIVTMGGNNGTTLNTTYRYDGAAWSEWIATPHDVAGAMAATLSNRIYLVGGYAFSGVNYSNVYRYPGEALGIGVWPFEGAVAGGFSVAITGTNLSDGTLGDVTNVTLAGVAATVTGVSGSTQIVVTASAAGGPVTGDVVVASASHGRSVRSNAFTYVAGAGEPDIQITGPAFAPLALGRVVTNVFTVTNAGAATLTMTAATNDGAGSAYFDVAAIPASVEAGTASNFPVVFTASAVGAFTPVCYVANNSPAPNYAFGLTASVFSVSTLAGPYAGGNTLTITNGHFGTITNVLVGGVAATIQGSGASWVTISVPMIGATGLQSVVIQTSDQGSTTLADAYTVNQKGGMPDPSGLPAWVSLTNTWFNGTNGVRLTGSKSGAMSGSSVSSAGDVNGDGHLDLLIGAYGARTTAGRSAGEGYLVYGLSTGLPLHVALTNTWLDGTNGVTFEGLIDSAWTGQSVDSAGDINGDGYADFMIGAYQAVGSGSSLAGATYVVFGRSNGLPTICTMTNTWLDGTNGFALEGAAYLDNVGYSVSAVGDFNQDGFDDMLIGARRYFGTGAGHLVYGRSNGFPAQITLSSAWLDGTNGCILAGRSAGSLCGSALSSAGDFNGDGLPDLLIGADMANPSGVAYAGETYLVYGRTNSLSAWTTLSSAWLDGTNGCILAGTQSNGLSGCAVSSAGDVNGDGFSDLLIGSYASPNGLTTAGETYLVFGRSNGLPAQVSLSRAWLDGTNGITMAGAGVNYRSGSAVSSAGDVNADGLDDLLIGAYFARGGQTYLIYGRRSGFPALITLTNIWLDGVNGNILQGAAGGDCSGWSVNPAGDMNQDGYDDFLIGATQADPFGIDGAGETYLVYGRRLFTPVYPFSGSFTGGYPVVINGTNLGSGVDITNVTICGASVAGIVSQSSTQVVVVAGDGDPGLGDVHVFSTSYGETVRSNAFTYTAPGIRVTGSSFAPIAVGRAITNLFAVTNSGDEALLITAATNDGAGAAYFAVSMPTRVERGMVSNFPVVFSPGAVGTFAPLCYTVNNSLTSNYSFALSGKAYGLSVLSGPYAGGNLLTITNGHIGTVTNVTVGGVSATILDSGANWVTIAVPAVGAAGPQSIVIQTSENGEATLESIYMINPAGQIGSASLSVWTNLGYGTDYDVNALDWDGTNLFVGGWFTSVGGLSANYVAKWDTQMEAWGNLGNGVDNTVNVLALVGEDLYVGGEFYFAGEGTISPGVAKWSAASATWATMADSMDGAVRALSWDGTNLYVGGGFATASGVAANRVAKWDPTTSSWSNLGDGLDSDPMALLWNGSHLYAGGWFTTAGGLLANYVAKWDPATGTWSNLGDGLDGGVNALAWDGTNLYAGGWFANAGGVPANNVAKWDPATGSWTNLGDGLDSGVNALAWDGTNLYAGGEFQNAGGVLANFVAKWDPATGTWTNLGSGFNGAVRALLHDGTNLYAGGSFSMAGEVSANNMAEWKQISVESMGVEPVSGSTTGGYEVVISGLNLGDGADVTNVTLCGASVASIISQSATQVIVVAGGGDPGLGDVHVFSTSYGESVRSDAFTYEGAVQAAQTITFAPLADQLVTNRVGLAATASSGLPVSFSVSSGPGNLDGAGTNLSFTGAGMVSIVASQAGDASWLAAPEVTNTFRVWGLYGLEIRSAHGTANPAWGAYENVEDTWLTNSVTTPDGLVGTQYVCAGWTMSGHEPASGVGTQLVMIVTNDAVLTWLWTTNYWLDTDAGAHGSVTVADGWQAAGSTVYITATPELYYELRSWAGDYTGNDNPLSVLMGGPRQVVGSFGVSWTTNRPTPLWWLAKHGLTNGFEDEVNGDADGDGASNWEEFIMDTSPTNASSYLVVMNLAPAFGTNCWDVVFTNAEPPNEVVTNRVCDTSGTILTWPASTGRVYRVESSPSVVASPWQPINHLTNLVPTSDLLTITNEFNEELLRAIRVRVELPPGMD